MYIVESPDILVLTDGSKIKREDIKVNYVSDVFELNNERDIPLAVSLITPDKNKADQIFMDVSCSKIAAFGDLDVEVVQLSIDTLEKLKIVED